MSGLKPGRQGGVAEVGLGWGGIEVGFEEVGRARIEGTSEHRLAGLNVERRPAEAEADAGRQAGIEAGVFAGSDAGISDQAPAPGRDDGHIGLLIPGARKRGARRRGRLDIAQSNRRIGRCGRIAQLRKPERPVISSGGPGPDDDYRRSGVRRARRNEAYRVPLGWRGVGASDDLRDLMVARSEAERGWSHAICRNRNPSSDLPGDRTEAADDHPMRRGRADPCGERVGLLRRRQRRQACTICIVQVHDIPAVCDHAVLDIGGELNPVDLPQLRLADKAESDIGDGTPHLHGRGQETSVVCNARRIGDARLHHGVVGGHVRTGVVEIGVAGAGLVEVLPARRRSQQGDGRQE